MKRILFIIALLVVFMGCFAQNSMLTTLYTNYVQYNTYNESGDVLRRDRAGTRLIQGSSLFTDYIAASFSGRTTLADSCKTAFDELYGKTHSAVDFTTTTPNPVLASVDANDTARWGEFSRSVLRLVDANDTTRWGEAIDSSDLVSTLWPKFNADVIYFSDTTINGPYINSTYPRFRLQYGLSRINLLNNTIELITDNNIGFTINDSVWIISEGVFLFPDNALLISSIDTVPMFSDVRSYVSTIIDLSKYSLSPVLYDSSGVVGGFGNVSVVDNTWYPLLDQSSANSTSYKLHESSNSYKPAHSFYNNDSVGFNPYGVDDMMMVNSKGDTLLIYTRDSIYFYVPIKGSHGITGSGTPGGSTTQVQYNNAGSFGGITGFTYTGTSLLASNSGRNSAISARNTIADGVGVYVQNNEIGIGVRINPFGGFTNNYEYTSLQINHGDTNTCNAFTLYRANTLKYKIDSAGRTFMYDSLYLPHLASPTRYGLLYYDSLYTSVKVDSIEFVASKGLIDTLQALQVFFNDRKNGELKLKYYDKEGNIYDNYGLAESPNAKFAQLLWFSEHLLRYNIELENKLDRANRNIIVIYTLLGMLIISFFILLIKRK